jgi:tRNA 2-selenouridine synthase
MIYEIDIEEFIGSDVPLIDVRSPGEYAQGHIPGGVNIPLFSDEERAAVGTVYTRDSREKAIELGYSYVYPKMNDFISQTSEVVHDGKVAIHCWRGGMRSHAFAEHLNKNGFGEVMVIRSGYKSYRNHVLAFFRTPLFLKIIGGYTGSGKTHIIRYLLRHGYQALDLEAIANHKGSAFGSIGQQPTTEQFENDLFEKFHRLDLSKPVWLEDESRNIGGVNIPRDLYLQMAESDVYFLEIPRNVRSEHLVNEYIGQEKEHLAENIRRISKRLGGENAREALHLLTENRMVELASLILGYYDKTYQRGLEFHTKGKIIRLQCAETDPEKNGLKILHYDEQIRNQAYPI